MLTKEEKRKMKLMLVAAANCIENDIPFGMGLGNAHVAHYMKRHSSFELNGMTTYIDWDCFNKKINKIIMMNGEKNEEV